MLTGQMNVLFHSYKFELVKEAKSRSIVDLTLFPIVFSVLKCNVSHVHILVSCVDNVDICNLLSFILCVQNWQNFSGISPVDIYPYQSSKSFSDELDTLRARRGTLFLRDCKGIWHTQTEQIILLL